MRLPPAAAVLLVLAAATARGDDVTFPKVEPRPAPAPRPVPQDQSPPAVGPGVYYVIDSAVPLLVTTSPPGAAAVTQEDGPVRVRGVFVDGDGKVETRTFKGKVVTFVDVLPTAQPGTVFEVIAFREGAKAEADLLRRTLVVSGTAPQPPPKPDPTPDVKPDPAPTPADPDPIGAGGFAVLMTYDPDNTTRPPAELSVIYGKAVREYLDAKCAADPAVTGWKAYRIWPSNTAADATLKPWAAALAKANAGGKDWILIGTGTTGYSGRLPKTEAETLALLRKYGGN